MKKILCCTFTLLLVFTGFNSSAQQKKPVSVLTAQVLLVPDSVVIIGKSDTMYLVTVDQLQAIFFTTNHDLYRGMVNHLSLRFKEGVSVVYIQGVSIDPLSKAYKKDFRSIWKKKASMLNNYSLYRITGSKFDIIPVATNSGTSNSGKTNPGAANPGQKLYVDPVFQ